MAPAAAGFFGAVLAVGWTVSEIASASLDRTRTIARLVAAAPVIMAVGLGLGALVLGEDAPWPLIVVWTIGLFIAGCGVGVAWPHLSAWIMGAVDDPVEAGTAAAAINTVQLISGAFGAGLAGIVVNLTEGGDWAAARWLFAVFAIMAAAGVGASYRASRGRVL
jgi:MFS family permease